MSVTERISVIKHGEEVVISSRPVDDSHYNFVGTEAWEAAEQSLLDYWCSLEDHFDAAAGTYHILVTSQSGATIADVIRNLPLHPAYAALTYKQPSFGNAPVRAFVVRLTKLYPGLTLEQAADHVDAFSEHYQAEISTDELAAATGYRLPADTPRPLSPYAKFQHPDDIPERLR